MLMTLLQTAWQGKSSAASNTIAMLCIRQSWAARYNTWLVIKLMQKVVVFSFLSIRLYQVWIKLYAAFAGAVKPVSGYQ